MKILFNVKLQNIYRVFCMDEEDLNNEQLFYEQGKPYEFLIKLHDDISNNDIQCFIQQKRSSVLWQRRKLMWSYLTTKELQ